MGFCTPTGFEENFAISECFASSDFTKSFTVPSDCTCLVISLAGYAGGGGTLLSSAMVWDDADTSQSMTLGARTSSGSNGGVVEFWYLISPTTGALDVTITPKTNGIDGPASVLGFYFLDIDETGTIVDSDTTQYNATSLACTGTGASGDIAIAVCDYYLTLPSVTAGTSIDSSVYTGTGSCSGDNYYAAAYDDTGTSFDITFGNVGTSYSTAGLIVLKSTAASGSVVPVLMHHYKQMNNS